MPTKTVWCLAIFTATACAGAPQKNAELQPSTSAITRTHTQQTTHAVQEAKIGDQAICPVSHESFTVTDKSPSHEYNGKKIFFCCEECADTFAKNPTGFLPRHP